MKFTFTVILSLLSLFVHSQKHLAFLQGNIPDRFETDERMRYFEKLTCDSVVGLLSSSKSFSHLTDKNLLTNKNGIGIKYLGDEALSDSLFYRGLFFAGLMKELDENGIKRIIDYRDGPLNRVVYDYDSNGNLTDETHYWRGKEYISRRWENNKLSCQSVALIKNGISESFCFTPDRYFSYYFKSVRSDTSNLIKMFKYSSVEISSFQVSYKGDVGCREVLQIDYFPGFIIKRNEYILDCTFEIISFEVNFSYLRKVESEGSYSYPYTNATFKKDNRQKIGEWKYYDVNNIIKKIVVYDTNGHEIDCKGDCDKN